MLECEKAKVSLSTCASVELDLTLMKEEHSIIITSAKFEELLRLWLEKSMDLVRATLADVKISKDEVDEVVLVGGSTRIPLVSQMLEQFFGKAPNQTVDPDEVVAKGAAVAATVGRSDSEVIFTDVTPLSLGVGTWRKGVYTYRKIIPRYTQVPTAEGKWYNNFTTLKDNQTVVDFEVRFL